jgi:hypothetical protein
LLDVAPIVLNEEENVVAELACCDFDIDEDG